MLNFDDEVYYRKKKNLSLYFCFSIYTHTESSGVKHEVHTLSMGVVKRHSGKCKLLTKSRSIKARKSKMGTIKKKLILDIVQH